MSGYDTLLFDLDHTLLDSDASEALAFVAALSAHGVAAAADHLPAYIRINRALWDKVERGEITPQHLRLARFEALAKEAALVVDVAALADAYADALGENGDLYGGAGAVLDALKQRARLGLVTNGLSEVQRARLRRLGLEGVFDVVVVSAEVGCAKPSPRIFALALEALGHPPKERVLMIGDSLSSDVKGAVDFGIASCWYNPAGKPLPSSGPRPTHEIAALEELLAIVPPTSAAA